MFFGVIAFFLSLSFHKNALSTQPGWLAFGFAPLEMANSSKSRRKASGNNLSYAVESSSTGHSTLSTDAGKMPLNRGNHFDKQTEDDLQEATALLRREGEHGTSPDEVWINPEDSLVGTTAQPTRAPLPTLNPVTKFNPLGQGIPHFNSRFADTNGEWEAVQDEQDPTKFSYRKFETYRNTSGSNVYHGETPGEAITAPDGTPLGL